jgi:flagellin
MSLSLRTNVASLNAQRNLYQTQMSLDASMARLSSGMRITKAGDDAAGLGISTNLEAQVKSYNQAVRNANDGMSVIQTAESAMNQTTNILSRLRELAMQASSSGVGATERGYIQKEADSLVSELDRTSKATEYNGSKLLDGSATQFTFQIGIRNNGSNDQITFTAIDATAATLVGGASLDVSSSQGAASTALDTIDNAIKLLSTSRADLGAAGNRFEMVISGAQTFAESLAAANSRIRDVDVASETANLSRTQILTQAGISVLAQANQVPQLALKLLQ